MGIRAQLSLRLVVAGVALALVVLLVGVPGAQALSFGSPGTISGADALLAPADNGGSGQNVSVAMDAAGDAIATWLKYSNASTTACPCTVRAAYRPAGGSFGAPFNVSPVSQHYILDGANVAMDSAGDATIVWETGTGVLSPADQSWASLRPAGRSTSFVAPVQVSTDARGGSNPVVRMDSAGDTVVVYLSEETAQNAGVEAVWRPAGGSSSFGTPQVVTSNADNIPDCCVASNLAMSPNGRAIVAFGACDTSSACNSGSPQTGNEEVKAAVAPEGGPFGAPATVSPVVSRSQQFGIPPLEVEDDVAIDDSGDAAVAFRDETTFTSGTGRVASSDGGGTFGTAATIGATGTSAVYSVVIDPDRETIAELSTSTDFLGTEVRPAGGAFGSAAALGRTTRDSLGGTLITASNLEGSSGETIAPWLQYPNDSETNASVLASVRPQHGSFGSTATVATTTGGKTFAPPTGAINKAGNQAVLVWQQANGPIVATTGGPAPPPKSKPPNTSITGKKISKSKHSASFKFKATGAKASGFQCALVKAPKKGKKAAKPKYSSCRSPKSYKHLGHGSYTFHVRAKSAAGTDKTPASATFKI